MGELELQASEKKQEQERLLMGTRDLGAVPMRLQGPLEGGKGRKKSAAS